MSNYIPRDISYTLVSKRKAVLLESVIFYTGIVGHDAKIDKACIDYSGECTIYKGFQWDFASGPAIDTPDMVIGSLIHDALCRLDDQNKLGYKFRKQSDKYFRKVLKELETGFIRRWYVWAVVRAYSVASQRFRYKSE